MGGAQGPAIISETVRAEPSPFRPHHPSIGMKTIPVVQISNPQDNDVQLAGGRLAVHGRDEPVPVSRPREPSNGVILMSAIQAARNHKPAPIQPVKEDDDILECSEDEEVKMNLGSPPYNPPDVLDDIEYGHPRDPLEDCYSPPQTPAPSVEQAVNERDSSHSLVPETKAQFDSAQRSSVSQDEIVESLQSSHIEVRGSAFAADLVDCTTGGTSNTKLVLSVPAPGCPSDTNARPDEFPSHPVDSGDYAAAASPAPELPDPSGPRTQAPPDPEPEPEPVLVTDEGNADRDEEPLLLFTNFFLPQD